MTLSETPHFHNEPGVARVGVGVREFMCMGALPPFDHPHVYIDMGDKDEAICPYCATLFVFDATLDEACNPPECAYPTARATFFEGAAPSASAPLPKPATPAQGGVIGAFATESGLIGATERLRALRFDLQTFTPKAVEGSDVSSPLPLIALISGLSGAVAGFVMQTYANVVAYPLDIGGRPKFSWPAFVPIAFEIGILFAVASVIIGAFIVGGLFNFYDPIDECEAMRRAMRDRWVVAVRTDDPERRARARAILAELNASDIEEIAA